MSTTHARIPVEILADMKKVAIEKEISLIDACSHAMLDYLRKNKVKEYKFKE